MNRLCACGCGKELSNFRNKYNYKYLRGHYRKKRKISARQKLLAKKKKILRNKYFAHRYAQLIRINTLLKKMAHKRIPKEEVSIDYNEGKKYCKKYDNESIICVMCYEMNEGAKKICYAPSVKAKESLE